MVKKILIFLVFFFSTLSFASDIYIKLGTTTSNKQVQQIKNIIDSMGYKLYTQQEDAKVHLYTGPHKNKNAALEALQRLKKVFPSAAAVKLRTSTVESNIKESSNVQNGADDLTRPFFVTASLGFHNTKGDLSGTIDTTLIEEPKDSGMSYGIEFGYKLNRSVWFGIGYEILGTGDLTINNAYMSANYNFLQASSFDLYGGIVAGYSSLKWNSDPLVDAESLSGPSSFFAGAQLGISYPLGARGLALIGSYSLLNTSLKTVLSDPNTTTTSTIEHTMMHNLKLGLQYSF